MDIYFKKQLKCASPVLNVSYPVYLSLPCIEYLPWSVKKPIKIEKLTFCFSDVNIISALK